MSTLRKQRLKPWSSFIVLGGGLCPGSSSISVPQVKAFENSQYIEWKYELQSGERANECPFFMECGGSLPEISYCFVPGLNNLRMVTMRPPKMLNNTAWRGLSHTITTLPWEGQLVSVRHGAYVNALGQVFTNHVQYYHGGCQDIVDREHGGQRKYVTSDTSLSVTQFSRVLNLIHVHGYNYYHFLIEVLPRFYLSKRLLETNPYIPILIRSSEHLHLLKLIGLDPEYLNIKSLDAEEELVYASKEVFFPLAPRCLHAPASLWKQVRREIAQNLPAYFLELPTDFVLYDTLSEYYKSNRHQINIVYFSRANYAHRRNLVEEAKLLEMIINQLSLQFNPDSRMFEAVLQGNDEDVGYDQRVTLTTLYGNESLPDVIQHVSKASIIIGTHGAALSNIIFAPKTSHLLEIAPEGYWNPCFMYLSNSLELKHYMIRAHGQQNEHLCLEQNVLEDVVVWLKGLIHDIS